MAFFSTLDRDGTGDFDRDGLSDRAEFLAGTTRARFQVAEPGLGRYVAR